MSTSDHSFRFRWWMPAGALGLILLVAAGVLVALFAFRDEPGAKPVTEAVTEFRSSTMVEEDAAAATLRPPRGVYRLAGEGREDLSFPPLDQEDGAEMPMTIRHAADGCWVLRIDYNEAYWQDWTLCPTDRGLVQNGKRTSQRWDLGAVTIENVTTFVCDPPSMFVVVAVEPGDAFETSCTGTNEEVGGESLNLGTMTFVGEEALTIGEERVDALHFRHANTLSGTQVGPEDLDLWFRATDALPLRGVRALRVDSDSPFGPISYTEEGSWQVLSTEPIR